MNIITQLSLFEKHEFQELGDLELLLKIVRNLNASELIRKLDSKRKNGRNDWSNRSMLIAFIGGLLFGHDSQEALRRELNRNQQFREICGFKAKTVKVEGEYKKYLAPSRNAFSRFISRIMECKEELNNMFIESVYYMYNTLDGFGEYLTADGKALDSYATKLSKSNHKDERGEHDADWCKKEYTVTGINGEIIKKTKKWLGFRMHLIADAKYEIPVDFTVTKASISEKVELNKMLKKDTSLTKLMLSKCKYFLADKGYDSTNLIETLKTNDIAPIIDIRNMWKSGEKTKQYRNTDLTYDYEGNVYYTNEQGKEILLKYKGYDKSTDSLRYGFGPQHNDNRIFRIKCDEDKRIFTPVARNSEKWSRIYKMRTSVEKINGRIDRDYKFENHTIRGLKKMTTFITLSFVIYMTMAKAKIAEGLKSNLCKKYA